MKDITTGGRALAIVAGIAFTYGGLRIILGDTLTDPSQWTTSAQLTVLMVFGTIAAGHLMCEASRARHVLAVFGFLALFLAGTGLVVFNSVGRQAEATMLTVSQADDVAERRVVVKSALARAEAMLTDAQGNLARECKSGRGTRCKGIEATVGVYEAAVKGHLADLERIGPPKPVNAKATQGAKIAALFGVDETKAKAALLLIEPFLWTLFFELGSVISLGFAFRHRPAPKSSEPERPSEPDTEAPEHTDHPAIRPAVASNVIALVRPSDDEDPKPPKKGRTYRKDEALADIVHRMQSGNAYRSQRELADDYGVPYQTLSDWIKSWEADGLVIRRKEGRRKIVAAG